MASIICRHRNQTLFERLADSVPVFHSFIVESIDGKNVAKPILVKPSFLHSELNYDGGTVKMYWYQAKNKSVITPQRVVKDAIVDEFTFISLCGHICSDVNYKKTEESIDVTEMLADIVSQQPKGGRFSPIPTGLIKNKILHFSEIPSEVVFSSILGREWNYGYSYQRVSKYFRDKLFPSNTSETNLRGNSCPLVDDGFYENLNFYDEDSIWYNPSKKFVQINHAVTKDNFFDRDGFLCSINNYENVLKERVEKYKKMFLFLI